MLAQTTQERNEQKQMIAAAQERLNADAGWAYMRQLGAAWFEQGYTAALFGIDPNDPGLFSAEHRAGYRAFQAGHPVKFVSAGAPALLRQ
jgi:hypothetical protein